MKVGAIGGTGVYDPTWLDHPQEVEIKTPYGSVTVMEGALAGHEDAVYFLNRHGAGHALPPHRVNYRANLWALRELGVKRVIATAAVGSMNLAMAPGSLVLVDQFLDFTKGRPSTFYEGGAAGVRHTDMTEPYCRESRQRIFESAQALGLSVVLGGVYVATEGPRFESAQEIRAYRLLGGDVVGMTGVPEVVLARELGLCYAAVALVTNFAAGLTGQPLTHEEVLEVMRAQTQQVQTLLKMALARVAEPYACSCPA
ncbi:MAG: S-methyl-5'-thioadenosine phosphorylase [Firmicutes bacterium]|nr:S-methyl-5'-thioadenosine phosphorylase [Bacillota bacterium]